MELVMGVMLVGCIVTMIAIVLDCQIDQAERSVIRHSVGDIKMDYKVYCSNEKIAEFKYIRDAIEFAQRYANRSIHPTSYHVEDSKGQKRYIAVQ